MEPVNYAIARRKKNETTTRQDQGGSRSAGHTERGGGVKTLESYLKKEFESTGAIDFRIRIQPTGRQMTGSGSPDSRLSFYIHPIDKNGDTLDFWVDGNKLAAVYPEPTQPDKKGE